MKSSRLDSRIANAFVNGAEFRNIVRFMDLVWRISSMKLLNRLNEVLFSIKKNYVFLFDSTISTIFSHSIIQFRMKRK